MRQLTSGRHWRLYYQQARSRSEEFLEPDLANLAGQRNLQADLFSPERSQTEHFLCVFISTVRTYCLSASARRHAGTQSRRYVILHQAAFIYRLEAAGGATVPASIDARQLDWFSKQIASKLRPPDLSEYGYRLIDQHLMTRDGGRHAVRLIFANPQGHSIDLVREMRWQEEGSPELRVMKNGDVTVAYWLDGPLIYGLVGQLGRDRLLELAGAVRRSSRMLQDAAPKHVNSEALSGADAPMPPEASHRVEPMQPPSPLGRM
jgi:hypothetical protein